jgi:membrane protein DedA with SNARE-associated domain
VEQGLTDLFNGYGPHILYLLTFLVLVVCGLGLPIPEELIFLAAGFAGRSLNANVMVLCAFGVLGILTSDTIPFLVGRRYGMEFLTQRHFAGILSTKNLERAHNFFRKHGSKTVFFARFVAGLRMPTYFMAGSMGERYLNFILWDLLGALITCPISIVLAFFLGAAAKHWLKESKLVVFSLLGIILFWAVFAHWLRRRKKHPGLAPSVAENMLTGKAGDASGDNESATHIAKRK